MPLRRLALSLSLTAALFASAPPETDRRNVEILHTDSQFRLEPYPSLAAWQKRAEELRSQILFSAGLLPLPEKRPLNAQVFGRIEHEDYSVEKVLLETYPGFYLGGNLYRPRAGAGPFPAIVSPHGHWRYGRLEHQPLGSVPARAANLARQGFVVFTYDMVGYNDTRQLPHEALGGPREQLWGVGLLGVQLWNSIRAVDFVSALPDVDPERIAATGASGGGTQTFLLSAVDNRVRYSAPVNMVSGIMQGGSPCENAPLLRIGTNNIEIAALAAPRPMLLVSATGDWTRNVPEQEFPQVREIYRLFGAEDEVEVVQIDAPHNYNQESREAVYSFFGRKILGVEEPERFKEKSFPLDGLSDMLALWGREIPDNAVSEQEFLDARIAEAEATISALMPDDRETVERTQQDFRQRLQLAIQAEEPRAEDVVTELVEELNRGERFALGRRGKGDRIPSVVLRPKKEKPEVRPTLIVHPEGVAWTLSSAESRSGFVSELLSRGGGVMGVDVYQTANARVPREMPSGARNAERYFMTFNRTDDANRIQDVLTAIAYARLQLGPEINVVGFGRAGLWATMAAALAGDGLHLVADLDQFDASDDDAYENNLFIPGIRKAGDFRAVATLLPAGSALLHNVSDGFPSDWVKTAFESAGKPDQVEVRSAAATDEEILDRIAPTRRNRRR